MKGLVGGSKQEKSQFFALGNFMSRPEKNIKMQRCEMKNKSLLPSAGQKMYQKFILFCGLSDDIHDVLLYQSTLVSCAFTTRMTCEA